MSYKILVVDDEQNIREIIREFLEERGYRISIAVDGQDALDKICFEQFDLYIVDVYMPRLNGLELMKKIKQMNPLAVVIITTGYSSIEGAMKAIRGGAFHYLTKPIIAEELFKVVETGLRHYDELQRNLQKPIPGLNEEAESAFDVLMLRGFSNEAKMEFHSLADSRVYNPGDLVPLNDELGSIIIVDAGELSVWLGDTLIERLRSGESWGEETFLAPTYLFTNLRAEMETRVRYFSTRKMKEFFTYHDESLTKRFTINLMNIFYMKWKKSMVKIGMFTGYDSNRV
jgi:CheY-like chemotaxis protein